MNLKYCFALYVLCAFSLLSVACSKNIETYSIGGDWEEKPKEEEKNTVIVDCNGGGDYLTIQEAIDNVRSIYLTEDVTISIKQGIYYEKIVIPKQLKNISFVGEDAEKTILTYDDYAGKGDLGTSDSYSVLVQGTDIVFENLTIENAAGPIGQAVAIYLANDRIVLRNCRLLGNQDTVYTGGDGNRMYFEDCYIDGTTDYIFGNATCWFENCILHCKANSYITAASTSENIKYGYVFNKCEITFSAQATNVYLGRPWRPYSMVLFMNSVMNKGIRPEGWHNWGNPENELTARYMEFNNSGVGSDISGRVNWSKKLVTEEAAIYTITHVMGGSDNWNPVK